MRVTNTNVSGADSRFFDPVRGDPPDDCEVLGWSCCCDPTEDDDRNTHRNAMEMAAGGPQDRE